MNRKHTELGLHFFLRGQQRGQHYKWSTSQPSIQSGNFGPLCDWHTHVRPHYWISIRHYLLLTLHRQLIPLEIAHCRLDFPCTWRTNRTPNHPFTTPHTHTKDTRPSIRKDNLPVGHIDRVKLATLFRTSFPNCVPWCSIFRRVDKRYRKWKN